MLYLDSTLKEVDALLRYKMDEVSIYRKLTGVQANSIAELEKVYLRKVAVDQQISLEYKEKIKALKIKNFYLTVSLVAVTAGGVYYVVKH